MPEVKVVDTLTARTRALEAVEVDDPLKSRMLKPNQIARSSLRGRYLLGGVETQKPDTEAK